MVGPLGVQTIDQISGGERVALAIALRLAIARVLSGKVETIMDEPTTYLDEERRKELVNILDSFFRRRAQDNPPDDCHNTLSRNGGCSRRFVQRDKKGKRVNCRAKYITTTDKNKTF